MKQLSKIELNFKLNLMSLIIILTAFSIGGFAYYLMDISKNKIDKLYQKRFLPLVKYEKIKDIYIINVSDTLKEFQYNHISAEDTIEILTLSKELISKEWNTLKNRCTNNDVLDILNETEQKIDNINNIIDVIILELVDKRYSSALEVVYLELTPEIDSIRFNLNYLIEKSISLAYENKKNLDKKYNQLTLFLVISVLLISLLAYILSIPIKESIGKLYQKIKKKNDKLIKTKKTIDKHVILSETDKDGIITYTSSAFCEVSGYNITQLVGKTHRIVSHEDTEITLYKELWSTIKSKNVWQGEIENKRLDGSSFWLYMVISPKLDEKGDIDGYISISKDITDKKTIQRQQKQLIQQSRHAAMGEMISMIAHQWRQPLATISAIISDNIIKSRLDTITSEDLDRSYDEISSLLSYLSNTVDDFRNFFKPNKNKETIYLNNILDAAINIIHHSIKSSSINLHIKGTDNIEVEVYKNEMIQVIINIVKNAIDELVKIDNKKNIDISYYKDDKYAHIDIKDNAGGIPADIIKKIFNPYFSTKSKNGTGLGLYMSKIIVNEHLNGNLTAENIDDGALFKISIPLKDSDE
jgi:PAS domain S-box-containing protein